MGSAVFKSLQALQQNREKSLPISLMFCKSSGPDAQDLTVAEGSPSLSTHSAGCCALPYLYCFPLTHAQKGVMITREGEGQG